MDKIVGYKNLDNLIQAYKPLRFKFLGFNVYERQPYYQPLLIPLVHLNIRLNIQLKGKVNYFDLRPLLTEETRKLGDIWFLTHYIKRHGKSESGARANERLWYLWLRLRYYPELSYINRSIEGTPHDMKLPRTTALYLARWGYLMSVPSGHIEFVHGVDYRVAELYLDGLVLRLNNY